MTSRDDFNADGIASSDAVDAVRTMMEAHWVEQGYCAPNSKVYPWQWLWDSCFHAIVWAELGDDRGVREIERMFHVQDEAGFVPHMNYELDPSQSTDFWGRPGASSITQPPMYGHAIAELVRRGLDVPDELVESAVAGLRFLVEARRRDDATSLINLVHPWESGADDSARWDAALASWNLDDWRAHKSHLVGTVEANAIGSPIDNPEFRVASIGFNSLVVFNIDEFVTLGVAADLIDARDELASAIAAQWDEDLGTWVDGGDFAATSGRARTADAFYACFADTLPERLDRVEAQLRSVDAYGGPFGPAGAHKAEPTYDGDTYWRGPAWPQMSYLIWLAMHRAGRSELATSIADTTRAGALRSGLAEYWNPDTGVGNGAIPQSWAGLAIVLPAGNAPDAND